MDDNFRGNVSFPLKVGLVGCGKWGSVLKKKLSNLGVLIAWCGGRDLLPLQSRLRNSSIPAVDWIIIATPATTHFSLALEALEAGKNVFQALRQRIDVTDREGGHAVTRLAGAFGGFAQAALSTAPTNEQHVAFFRAEHFRLG